MVGGNVVTVPTATNGETNSGHKRTRDDEDYSTRDRLCKKCRGNTEPARAIAEKQKLTVDILLRGTVSIGPHAVLTLMGCFQMLHLRYAGETRRVTPSIS